MMDLTALFAPDAVTAFFEILMIDIVLAGDNAIVFIRLHSFDVHAELGPERLHQIGGISGCASSPSVTVTRDCDRLDRTHQHGRVSLDPA